MYDSPSTRGVVRIEELRQLETSERALGMLYLHQVGRPGARRLWLQRMARQQLDHAARLRERRSDLGAPPDEEPLRVAWDDPWIRGAPDDPETLRRSVYAAIATYHDHLGDYDPETMELLRDHILPEHVAALAELERGRPTARLSEV